MNTEANAKVQARHLSRKAYLYVRQSTLRQVFENTESTKRQYALKQRAIALGWPLEQVVVIDSDLGRSGASAVDREGFQRLVTEVGLGRAGIVMGLEVSRLARNSTDWQLRQTPAAVVELVDKLAEFNSDDEIARQLNEKGLRSGWGHSFNPAIVRRIREQHHLQNQYDRLRSRGLLTQEEIAARLQVCPDTIKRWRRAGLLKAHRYSERGECLFEAPDQTSPIKHQHQGKKQALLLAKQATSNQPNV